MMQHDAKECAQHVACNVHMDSKKVPMAAHCANVKIHAK